MAEEGTDTNVHLSKILVNTNLLLRRAWINCRALPKQYSRSRSLAAIRRRRKDVKGALSACGKDIKIGRSKYERFQDTVNGLNSSSALLLLCSENQTPTTWGPKVFENLITSCRAELRPIGDVGTDGGLSSQTTLEAALYNAISVWLHNLPRQTSFKMTSPHIRKLLAKTTESKFDSCRIPGIHPGHDRVEPPVEESRD